MAYVGRGLARHLIRDLLSAQAAISRLGSPSGLNHAHSAAPSAAPYTSAFRAPLISARPVLDSLRTSPQRHLSWTRHRVLLHLSMRHPLLFYFVLEVDLSSIHALSAKHLISMHFRPSQPKVVEHSAENAQHHSRTGSSCTDVHHVAILPVRHAFLDEKQHLAHLLKHPHAQLETPLSTYINQFTVVVRHLIQESTTPYFYSVLFLLFGHAHRHCGFLAV